MRQALAMAAVLSAAFLMVAQVSNLHFALSLGFGATIVIAVTNTLTFLWLWQVRATPLALGMAFSWFGQASLSAWWFVARAPSLAGWITDAASVALFAMLSIYIVGGSLHIVVMRRSMELAPVTVIAPVLAAVAVACAAEVLL